MCRYVSLLCASREPLEPILHGRFPSSIASGVRSVPPASAKAQREMHPRTNSDVQRPIQAMVGSPTAIPRRCMDCAQRSYRLQRFALGKHLRLLFSVVDAVRVCGPVPGSGNEGCARCRRNRQAAACPSACVPDHERGLLIWRLAAMGRLASGLEIARP